MGGYRKPACMHQSVWQLVKLAKSTIMLTMSDRLSSQDTCTCIVIKYFPSFPHHEIMLAHFRPTCNVWKAHSDSEYTAMIVAESIKITGMGRKRLERGVCCGLPDCSVKLIW